MENSPEKNLQPYLDLIPAAPTRGGVYSPCLIVENLVYVSGHLPFYKDGTYPIGRVGGEFDIETSKIAARQVGYNIIATLRENLGSLDKIERVVKVFGMLNAVPEFQNHADVMNGCTELFGELWGEEKGLGTRSAVGMGSLPKGVPVEIEAIFLLKK
jgi:enamine deaminase RidA (YjgF/YER057c/UK114 family)